MSVGYVYDPIYVAHDRAGHPESASRLTAIMEYLESSGLIKLLKAIPAEAASIEDLGRIHSPALIEQVRQMAQGGGGHHNRGDAGCLDRRGGRGICFGTPAGPPCHTHHVDGLLPVQ